MSAEVVPMRVELINTGTELLLGNTLNTHLGFIAGRLLRIGWRIARQTTVPDGEAIGAALAESISRCEVVIVTGGLGPTADDVTREEAAQLLGRELRMDESVLRAIEERFARRSLKMAPRNRRQAMVPEGAVVLPNANGTAPGLYFPPGRGHPALFLLPGPPRELHPMFDDQVMPVLRALAGEGMVPECRIYRVGGLGESLVEERIGAEVAAIEGIELGYCARPGEVDVRIIGGLDQVRRAEAIIEAALGAHVYARGDERMEDVVVRRLAETGKTLAVAESCTGGCLAHRLTNVPGASRVFLAGYVTYADSAKTDTLGVPADLLAAHGAVSAPVAEAMARGALAVSGADYALSTTGIAGPDGGTPDKPVGTVFIGWAAKNGPGGASQHRFSAERETFKAMAAHAAMERLRIELGRSSGG